MTIDSLNVYVDRLLQEIKTWKDFSGLAAERISTLINDDRNRISRDNLPF